MHTDNDNNNDTNISCHNLLREDRQQQNLSSKIKKSATHDLQNHVIIMTLQFQNYRYDQEAIKTSEQGCTTQVHSQSNPFGHVQPCQRAYTYIAQTKVGDRSYKAK